MAPTVATGGNADLVIKATLDCLTNDMLSSIRGHNPAVSSISSALSKVDSLVHSCHATLKNETKDLLSSFTNIMAFLPAGLQQAETETDALINQFSAETTALLQDKLGQRSSKRSTSSKGINMEPAARWLRDNWFNPYPSDSVRADMAARTRSTRKDIDTWFADSRKRIGWNSLRKKHFSTKRALIESATHFDSPNPSGGDGGCCRSIQSLLAGVKSEAQALYEKFTPSRLARTLEVATAPRKRPYPTPSKSPLRQTCSPSPSDQDLEFSPSTTRYRSFSPSDAEEGSLSSLSQSVQLSIVAPTAENTLPTPTTTPTRPDFGTPMPMGTSLDTTNPQTLEPPTSRDHTPQTSGQHRPADGKKRKRYLSDGFQYPAAKVPRIQQQTVSDQYPYPTTSEAALADDEFLRALDWFTTSSPSVLGQELDASVPIIVEAASLAYPAVVHSDANYLAAPTDPAPGNQIQGDSGLAFPPVPHSHLPNPTSDMLGLDMGFDAWTSLNIPDSLLMASSSSMQPAFNPLMPYNTSLDLSAPSSGSMAPCISNAFNLDMSGFMWNVPMLEVPHTLPSPHADVPHLLPTSAAPSSVPAESTQSREQRILQLEAELRMLKGADHPL
ncbi:mating-type protein beta 1-domain-containing protein [Coprinopsis sp. MPI-PUGE-AT-0042]|nr:mating-type protein beta 1-domain-containing protein [Coprinopsis sp. MPI-PUGE-AT-0042]